MNKALILLALAIVVGIAAAPSAAAACPPQGPGYQCSVIPLGAAVGCVIDWEGEYVAEAASDCL